MRIVTRYSQQLGRAPVQLNLFPLIRSATSHAGSDVPVRDGSTHTGSATVSTGELTRAFRVSRSTLWRWMKSRHFPARCGTQGWRRSDVEQWIAEAQGS